MPGPTLLRRLAPLALVAAGVGPMLGAARHQQVEPDEPPSSGEVSTPDLYLRDCATCHGGDGGGTPFGPPLADVGPAYVDYVLTTGRMPIDDPDAEVRRNEPRYDDRTIEALVDYVAGLGGGAHTAVAGDGAAIPALDLSGADAPHGGELYRLNCAACHQSVGQGGALIGRSAPSLDEATPLQVAEAVRVGPFEMPAFGRSALSDEDLADLTAYVTGALHEPEDRGGLAIWHLGPVPEGAVAFVVGLGVLMLVARWIENGSEDTDRREAAEPEEASGSS